MQLNGGRQASQPGEICTHSGSAVGEGPTTLTPHGADYIHSPTHRPSDLSLFLETDDRVTRSP
ncbi:uncharacterized protein LOC143148701 isoform X2 [Ptiloglossa arizonensis]|uniref:uncharacterized protein LOC143148701 isoform X2 n=1 Tax=Ptiloglossa arizonensis TaxID=3350558 RepID=UPI003F9F027E